MTDRHATEHLFLLAGAFEFVESRFNEVPILHQYTRRLEEWRRSQAYTYAILRFESSVQRCSHCSNLSSPLVSLNTPKGLNRTPTRPDPMAAHNLSTVSSVNRHLLVIDPPYSSLRWFTAIKRLTPNPELNEEDAYRYCGETGQINTHFLRGSQFRHSPPTAR